MFDIDKIKLTIINFVNALNDILYYFLTSCFSYIVFTIFTINK